MSAIRVRGLEFGFGRKTVLDGLDLDVAAGTTVALLGPNGAGKSTLLRACLGLLKPRAGTVDVLGLEPHRNAAAVQCRIGYVPDRPDVYPWMRVADLFRFLRPHFPTWSDVQARSQVEKLGVPTDTPFSKMSRGQGMKAMLAAALSHEPELLLLDEPFGGLDPLIREEVLRNVIGALADEGRTVLLATHDLEIAARAADRVAVLAHAKIQKEGSVDEFDVGPEPTPTAKRLHRALAAAAEEAR